MKIGLVSGNVVSTINHPFFEGHRLMICDLISPGQSNGAESVLDPLHHLIESRPVFCPNLMV